MKISRNMHLIIPVETEMGNAYIHAAPISKEVYREHFFVLSKTFSAIFSEGLGVVAGPRVAYLMLESICKKDEIWEGATGVRNTLVNEIIRLSNLVYPVEGKGWDTKPLEVALGREIVDLDEVIQILPAELVGQPTWIGPVSVSFKCPMRADLRCGDTVKLPENIISGPGALLAVNTERSYSSLRDQVNFSGNFLITSVRQVGDFLNPDNDNSWVTIYEAVALAKNTT